MATHRRDSVADVLGNVAHVNHHIGALLVDVLNQQDETQQAAQLRELGRQVGELSAELLARAAEADGRCVDTPSAVVIDARPETPGRCG